MPIKQPVSLCLHDIADVGANQSFLRMSVLSVPFAKVGAAYTPPIPVVCSYEYYNDDNELIRENVTEYTYKVESNHYLIPVAEWQHGDKVYYTVTGESADLGHDISCPPLMCRSDNGLIIVTEDEVDFQSEINSDKYEAHIFSHVNPNENGCITLPISLPSLNEITEGMNLWVNVYYYVPLETLQNKVLKQSFPIYRLYKDNPDIRKARIGFKTFYKEDNSDAVYFNKLPMVWIAFEEKHRPS